jgi:hypothetical protein
VQRVFFLEKMKRDKLHCGEKAGMTCQMCQMRQNTADGDNSAFLLNDGINGIIQHTMEAASPVTAP